MKIKSILGILTASVVAAACYMMVGSNDAEQGAYIPRTEAKTDAPNDWNAAHEYMLSLRVDRTTGEIPIDKVYEARNQSRNRAAANRSASINLTLAGPENIGGRTRALHINPDNAQEMFAGSVTGGLFVSQNAGGTWEQHPDWAGISSHNTMISCIAEGSNGDIWVGTGCSHQEEWPGGGLYRSVDDGASFQLVASTEPSNPNSDSAPWSEINRVAVDPNNPARIFACTNNGLQVSNNSGSTWENPIYLDPGCTLVAGGKSDDIRIDDNGRIYAVVGGKIYISDTGNSCDWDVVETTQGVPNSTSRMNIAMCASQQNTLYALYLSGSRLEGIYRTDDKGVTWTQVAFPIPGYFEPMFNGESYQGIYDSCIEVFPDDPDAIMVGGVQIWRYDGNLTRVAGEFFSNFSEDYVHSDKHYFTFHPDDPGTVYVTTDGGIFRSTDRGETWSMMNRGFTSTQYYGIAPAVVDIVMGGTQDNGTIVMFGDQADNFGVTGLGPKDGFRVLGGDGFDCEFSSLLRASFVQSQFGNLSRQKDEGDFSPYCPPYCEQGPFNSVIRLWESTNDPFSEDSISFENDTTVFGVAVGNGTSKTYTGVFERPQAAGSYAPGTVWFESNDMVVEDLDGDGVLQGDGSGTIDYSSGEFSVTFNVAPASQTGVFGYFSLNYQAGETLLLPSNTGENELLVSYTLQSSLGPGDQIRVQDPIQSMLAFVANNAIYVTRDHLDFSSEFATWLEVTATPGVRCIEWSEDGNTMYFGTFGGAVYRITGFSQLYDASDLVNLQQTLIFNSPGAQGVTGIALSPNNPDHMVVTLGNYGATSYVRLLTDINGAAGASTGNNLQFDLPEMPCYDAEILVDVDGTKPNQVVLGTENGVWYLEDYTNNGSSWENCSQDITLTPVYDIRQQKLPWQRAQNHEVIYVGTFGRGIWKSTDFVGVKDFEPIAGNDNFTSDVKVYPNPITNGQGSIEFNLARNTEVEIAVFDMNGKRVQAMSRQNYAAGSNTVQLNTSELPTGSYFVTLQAGDSYKVQKFMVMK